MAIDIIGKLYPQPTMENLAPSAVWGFHVNITPDVLEANPHLSAKVIVPATLRRVWAGDDPASPTMTVALRFNGETAARDALGDLWPSDPA